MFVLVVEFVPPHRFYGPVCDILSPSQRRPPTLQPLHGSLAFEVSKKMDNGGTLNSSSGSELPVLNGHMDQPTISSSCGHKSSWTSSEENLPMPSGGGDLRQELDRLQKREALLTHLLCLEREKRVKAEQLVEVEHQACLELGYRLGRERKLLEVARKRTAAQKDVSERETVDDGGVEDGRLLTWEKGEHMSTNLDSKDAKVSLISLSVYFCSLSLNSLNL